MPEVLKTLKIWTTCMASDLCCFTFRQEVPVFTGADKSLNGQQQPVPKVGVFAPISHPTPLIVKLVVSAGSHEGVCISNYTVVHGQECFNNQLALSCTVNYPATLR